MLSAASLACSPFLLTASIATPLFDINSPRHPAISPSHLHPQTLTFILSLSLSSCPSHPVIVTLILSLQSLGVETVDPMVMQRPPRNRQDDIITRPLVMRVLTSGLLILAGESLAEEERMMEGKREGD